MNHETRIARQAVVAVWVMSGLLVAALAAWHVSTLAGWVLGGLACVVAAGLGVRIHARALAVARGRAERIRARRSRRRARQRDERAGRWSDAIEAIATPMLATDGSGVVVWCTPRARDVLVPGAVVGRSLDEVLSNAELLAMHAAACAGTAQLKTVTLPLASGRAIYEVAATPIPTASGRRAGVVLTFQDITELAQTVQLKSDFVANASHELRTPVASICAAVETLDQLDASHDAMRPRLLSIVRSNAARLGELLGDLLDLSRLESSGASEPACELDLAGVVASIGESLAERTGPRSLRIVLEEAEDIRLVAPEGLVTLVLRNLLDNATRFADPGTSIRVVVSAGERAAALGGPGVRISVIDRGVGIPLADQARVFERFYQVDPARSGAPGDGPTQRGTGLGLAIVKHAVQSMGGRVGLESVWQQGTTVWFELPGLGSAGS